MEALRRRVSNRSLPHEPGMEDPGASDGILIFVRSPGAPHIAQDAGHFSAGNADEHDAQVPHDYYQDFKSPAPAETPIVVAESPATLPATVIEAPPATQKLPEVVEPPPTTPRSRIQPAATPSAVGGETEVGESASAVGDGDHGPMVKDATYWKMYRYFNPKGGKVKASPETLKMWKTKSGSYLHATSKQICSIS